MDLVDFAVAGPSAVLDSIHNVGIPWHTALPLTAVLVRTTLVYFISTRPARRNKEIQNQLVPLASAHVILEWNSEAERKRRNDMKRKNMSAAVQATDDKYTRWLAYQKAMSKLSKEYGVKRFRPWGLVNFGILIAFTEAIRLKCGAREGLLPTLLAPFEWVGRQIAPQEFPAPPGPDNRNSAEVLAERLQSAREKRLGIAQAQAQDPATGETAAMFPDDYLKALTQDSPTETTTELPTLSAPDTTSPYFDPSMQTEGLSWVTNLTLPDPTWVLPGMLFNTMFFSSLLRPTTATTLSGEKKGFLTRLTFVQRLGIAFAYLFFFAAINMPSAVLLYFVPSLAVGWLQQRWLDWRYPIQPAIQPCKRPIRMKIKKGW